MALSVPPSEADDRYGFRDEAHDLLQAVAAGSLVGMPLLYTMEMWWWGMVYSEWHLLGILGLALVANYFFCVFSGFRPVYSWSEAVFEAVTSVGLGIVISALILLLIGEIEPRLALAEILGKIVIEAIPVSIGISFANAKMESRSQDDEASTPEKASNAAPQDKTPNQLQLRQDLREMGAAAAGALLFSFNAAPTEEILMIQSRLSAWQILLTVPVSLLLCYIILFASGFRDYRTSVQSFVQRPAVETILAYAIALVVSFLLLAMVGAPGSMSDPASAISCTVVLGVLAAVGAAAGRLAS